MARSDDRAREKRLRMMMTDLQNIDPSQILPYLTCLSNMGKEQVRANKKNNGKMDAAAEMFEQLPKRENWYNILVGALRAIGEDDLADTLEGPEKKPDPSGPSQSVAMPEMSSHSTHVNQSQGTQLYQSPPAHDPPARQQTHPEAEASVSPGHPINGEQKGASHKGEKKEDDKPAPDPGQFASGSLQMPIQERRQEASPSDPQSRQSGSSAGSRASSPSTDLQVREESDTSPRREDRKVKEPACRTLPSNSSPTAGAVEVSVRPKDDMLRKDAAVRRMEEDVEKQREEKRKEVTRGDKNLNIPNVSSPASHAKNLPNIQKPTNYPNDDVNINNLSPTKDCREFDWDNGKTNNLEAPNVVEGQGDQCLSKGTRSLSSCDVDPDHARLLSDLSVSEICEGISKEPTTTPSGSRLQQIDEESAVSTQGVQGGGGGGRVGGGEEEGAAGGIKAGDENQNSLIGRMGSVARTYVPSIVSSFVEHVLTKP